MLSQSIPSPYEDLIGKSPEMQKVFKKIAAISNKEVLVLIEGDTGTGKELIAKAIHENSKRNQNLSRLNR